MVSAPSPRPPQANTRQAPSANARQASSRQPPPANARQASPANARQAYQAEFGRQPRHVPTDKFFADIDEAMSKQVSAQELRVLALREVQRSRVPATDKIELWIPAPQIARLYGTPEVMHAINRETQSQTWDAAMASLCALDVVKNRGIRVTCTNRDLAIKLGGTVVNCMGQKLIVKPYSAYERYYYVDLTHIPDGLDEDVIYDHFSALGLQPIIAPTHVAGSLMSRDRTVWFPETDVPDALFTDGVPLREIYFAGFDYPVYVQHKKRSLNKVLPPTIAKKRAETGEGCSQCAARHAADA
ncbi:hypothetical protein P3T76_016162 [Phytophthora citrophthora]|uniref:Uncharacterized protein n=1 Tax=Phytophthora citrophthora TaxID=4793 RepID=A0AAD9L9L5_9STRA|nr:hypothetical protein P3T76_016162 [Phytophthora citrophthora]